MNILEYIRKAFAGMHHNVDANLQNMTEDLFNWPSPGTANTISATVVHFLEGEDKFINSNILGKTRVWETGNWSEKTGVKNLPGFGRDWSDFKKTRVALQPVLDYKAAVWAATDAFLANLKEEDLDRMIPFAGREITVAEMLQLCISHSLGHNGEIAALKGVQGAKGLAI